MRVPVSDLRSELRAWIDRVRAGEEVTVTERGVPVIRLVPIDGASSTLERLIAEGAVTPARAPKRPVKQLGSVPRMRSGSLSDIVSEQRGS
jgi:prevent-host-death family protein